MHSSSKSDKIALFDANGPATSNQLYGLPFTEAESEIVVIPVPWEVTVSYASGTAKGPQAILEASAQVDLYDPEIVNAWHYGIYMLDVPEELYKAQKKLRKKAEAYIEALISNTLSTKNLASINEINEACEKMVEMVKAQCTLQLNNNKTVVLLGGDHSTPLGFIQALGEQHESFAILQIDAHADLRIAYEGFEYSHASIMYNALKTPQVSKLVQVGIRDYCQEEVDYINEHPERIKTYFDRDLKKQQFKGTTWDAICEDIVAQLPEKVYVSFDIDGLDPKYCPHTGTPVAGGFEADEVLHLVEKLVEKGKTIIGLDLNEVAPGKDEWDANVGARLLYRLCNLAAFSQKKKP